MFERGGMLDHIQGVWIFLADGARLLARDVECWEGPITTLEMMEVLGNSSAEKSPGYNSLTSGFYRSRPDMSWYLLPSAYALWQKNGKIPGAVG